VANKQISEELAIHQAPSTTQTETSSGLSRLTIWILSIASAATVANLYYSQPLLADIAHSFSASTSAVGIIATITQFGYALGLLLIVPLGDAIDRRKLISLSLIAVTVSLVGTALAPSLLFLSIASFALGVTTIIPQIIIPFAANLARDEERGKVIGTIMSGILIGILLARTVSGFIGAHFSWRAIYWFAAVMMVVLLFALRAFLPKEEPREHMSYPELLRSLWHLMRTEPVLREASLFGALAFGSFQVFWVTLAFYLGQTPYHYHSDVVGLFGLVGVVGATAATFIGKQTDRTEPRAITGIMIVIVLLTFLVFWLFGQSLWGLIAGVILLDLGSQGIQISNQARVYSLIPAARSRLNTIYMVSYFVGGTLGSLLGNYGWNIAGWTGVSTVGIVLMVIALGAFLVGSFRKAQA
jgi:predicted MFS family arabinose efflux permease